MYGIEYPALANSILKQDKMMSNSNINDRGKHRRKSSSSSASSSIIHNQNSSIMTVGSTLNQYTDSSMLTDILRQKLKSMTECPDYLMPKSTYTSSFYINSRHNKSSQQKANKNASNSNKYLSNNSQDMKSYYTDDFILLSEFSEIEGPKPLLTIPTDGGTGFNKNEYSLHLMCVDFHSHLQTSKLNSENDETFTNEKSVLNKFTLTKDTSIINYWDSNSMVASYVHHFTLNDLDARGFVRPFCLAYVSFDKTKPLEFFEQLKSKFTEITDLFKKSNLNQFKHDLEQRINDLIFTRDLFLTWSSKFNTEEENALIKLSKDFNLDVKTMAKLNSSCQSEQAKQLQLSSIDNLMKEMQSILDVIVYELKLNDWTIINYKPTAAKTRPTTNNNNKSRSAIDPSMLLASNDANKTRSNTYPIHSFNYQSLNANQNTNSKTKLYANVLTGSIANYVNNDSFSPNSLPSSPNMPKKFKRLHQLCSETAKQAINQLRLTHYHFSTAYYLLKYKQITSTKNETSDLSNVVSSSLHSSSPATSSSSCNNNSSHKKHSSHSSKSSNLFWSITFGDFKIADLSTNIDVFNLNKSNLIKKTNQNNPLSFSNNNVNKTISNNAENSNETQFFSPLNQTQIINKIETSSSTCTTNNNVEEFYSINDQMTTMTKTTAAATNSTWQDLEQYLSEPILSDEYDEEAESDENNLADLDEDESLSLDIVNKAECFEFDYKKAKQNENNKKDESEYDFVNSLLTFKQTENLTSFDDLSLSSQLSITSSSAGVYYNILSRQHQKYQSDLVTKLAHISEYNFEETLRKFLNKYSPICPHLFYSLLKGRPVICVTRYCHENSYLQSTLNTLSNFMPNSFYCLNDLTESNLSSGKQQLRKKPKFTSSPSQTPTKTNANCLNASCKPRLFQLIERKPIRLNDLKYCKLFGLNLMTNKSSSSGNHAEDFQELILKYIPITIQNYVSILDLDKMNFHGPKYRGQFLFNLIEQCKKLQQDSICFLFMLSNLSRYYVRSAFLIHYSVLFENESEHESRLKEKILRYFTLNNETSSETNASGLGYYSSLFTSSLFFNNSSYQALPQDPRHRLSSAGGSFLNYVYDDVDLMRLILAPAQSNNFFSYVTSSNSSGHSSATDSLPVNAIKMTSQYLSQHQLCQFETSDLNIVHFLLKSLKIKQIYLYNLAKHKKKLIEFKKMRREQTRSNKSQINFDTNIQFPLLIEYEEIFLIDNSTSSSSFNRK